MVRLYEDAEGVHAVVADSGNGLSEQARAHLFDAFFTTKAKGMGMGLFISRMIVEAHGGTITIDSQVGVGTTNPAYPLSFGTTGGNTLRGLLAALVAALVPLPYLELSPGPTYNTIGEVDGKPLIEISGARTYPTTGNRTAHAFYYPPCNAGIEPAPHTRPPLMVIRQQAPKEVLNYLSGIETIVFDGK